jgi:hypothetical protein
VVGVDGTQFRKIISGFASEMEISYKYSDDFITTLCRDINSFASCRWQMALYDSDLIESFPESPYWLAQIAKGSIPDELIDYSIRNEWVSLVIRAVLAINIVCQVFGHDDELQLLGLTVINSPNAVEGVLEVAKGLKVSLGFNENQNIPQIRDRLGISKHLLLIFNENQQLWPDFIPVVDAIYASVELEEIYQVIDFSREKECFDWLAFFESPSYLWGVYSLLVQEKSHIKRFNTTSSILEVIQVAASEGLNEPTIAKIVQESIWYKELQSKQPNNADYVLASLIQQATTLYRLDE